MLTKILRIPLALIICKNDKMVTKSTSYITCWYSYIYIENDKMTLKNATYGGEDRLLKLTLSRFIHICHKMLRTNDTKFYKWHKEMDVKQRKTPIIGKEAYCCQSMYSNMPPLFQKPKHRTPSNICLFPIACPRPTRMLNYATHLRSVFHCRLIKLWR